MLTTVCMALHRTCNMKHWFFGHHYECSFFVCIHLVSLSPYNSTVILPLSNDFVTCYNYFHLQFLIVIHFCLIVIIQIEQFAIKSSLYMVHKSGIDPSSIIILPDK